MLQIFGLLGVTGDILHTAFPLLGADTMRRLRAKSSSQAASVTRHMVAAVRRVDATLGSNGLQDHNYAVVFGYGLDELMWEHLILGHEFIWDVAEQLCQTGHLHAPGALRNGAPGSIGLKPLICVRLAR